jgi:hypothetical protein
MAATGAADATSADEWWSNASTSLRSSKAVHRHLAAASRDEEDGPCVFNLHGSVEKNCLLAYYLTEQLETNNKKKNEEARTNLLENNAMLSFSLVPRSNDSPT